MDQDPRRRSPSADRRALAMALRALREDAELSLEQAAQSALDASAAKLSRIETGKQTPAPRDVRDLCSLYMVSDERTEELIAWASSARRSGWWETYGINDDDYVGLESGAVRIREFSASFVPGLLQIPAYTEAYAAQGIPSGRQGPWGKREVAQWIEILQHRQRILRPESGVRLTFVLDEAALLRAVAGSEMTTQIAHLKSIREQPNVDLRVLPFSAGASPGQLGGFSLLTLATGPDVAYTESHAASAIIDDPDELARFELIFESILAASPPDVTDMALEKALTGHRV